MARELNHMSRNQCQITLFTGGTATKVLTTTLTQYASHYNSSLTLQIRSAATSSLRFNLESMQGLNQAIVSALTNDWQLLWERR